MAIVINDYELEEVIEGREPFTSDQREKVISHALGFEECIYNRSELEAMNDTILAKEYSIILYDYVASQL